MLKLQSDFYIRMPFAILDQAQREIDWLDVPLLKFAKYSKAPYRSLH